MTLVVEEVLVGVLLRRVPAVTQWGEPQWLGEAVLDEGTALPDWTILRREPSGAELWSAGTRVVRLHSTDTPNYLHNLTTPEDAGGPRAFLVLRAGDERPSLDLVTVDPGEAHHHADGGFDQVESVAMPEGLRARLEAFVSAHHVEREFHKRRRDRAGGSDRPPGDRPRHGGGLPGRPGPGFEDDEA